MRVAEAILLLILAAFAAGISIEATNLKYSDQYSFGPGFIPLTVGLLLILACGVQAFRLVRRSQEAEATDTPPDFIGLGSAAVIIVVGIAAMSLGSVLVPIAAIILLISWRVTRHPLSTSLIVSAATTATIYFIFSVWLGLPVS